MMTIVNVFMASTAFARIAIHSNDVQTVTFVDDNFHKLRVTGHIICDAGGTAHFRVTITQRTTGAVAEGVASIACTGEMQEWKVLARVKGQQGFEEGPVTVVYFTRTREGKEIGDAHQWLTVLTLTRE